jgi:hypothetical protein
LDAPWVDTVKERSPSGEDTSRVSLSVFVDEPGHPTHAEDLFDGSVEQEGDSQRERCAATLSAVEKEGQVTLRYREQLR